MHLIFVLFLLFPPPVRSSFHCKHNLTVICTLRKACIEFSDSSESRLVVYGSRHGAASHLSLVKHHLSLWPKIDLVFSPMEEYDRAAERASVTFPGQSIFLFPYQLHIPHFLEEFQMFTSYYTDDLSTDPNLFIISKTDQSFPLDYQRQYYGLLSRKPVHWESVSSSQAFTASSFDSYWARVYALNYSFSKDRDDISSSSSDHVPAEKKTACFNSIAFNSDGMWYHSTSDASRLRDKAIKSWGTRFALQDVCILQRERTRSIANLEEVLGILEKKGISKVKVIYTTSSHTVAEQAAMLSTCKELLAPHGAGLVNMNFLPKGAHVLEFLPTEWQKFYFRPLAHSNGIAITQVTVPRGRLQNMDRPGCLMDFERLPDLECAADHSCHWCVKNCNMTLVADDLVSMRPHALR